MWRVASKWEGHNPNQKALQEVDSAIKAARLIHPSAIAESGQGSAVVAESSSGLTFHVSGVLSDEGPPTCTCPAGMRGTVCEHVVKMLLLTGAKEHQLMRFLGMLMGSRLGGWRALHAAMRAAQEQPCAAASSNVAGAADQEELDPPVPPVSTGGSAGGRKNHSRLDAGVVGGLPAMAPGFSAIQWVTGAELQASCAAAAGRLQSLGEGAAAGGFSDFQKQQFQYAVQTLNSALDSVASRDVLLDRTLQQAVLTPNPDALWGMKRGACDGRHGCNPQEEGDARTAAPGEHQLRGACHLNKGCA